MIHTSAASIAKARRMFLFATAAVALLLIPAGCEAECPRLIHFEFPPDGGAGGSVPICDSKDAFLGSDGCFQPEQECCNTIAADLASHCDVATDGGEPVPYLCQKVPALGGAETDFRACEVIATASLECQWGPSSLLCCEVPQ